MASDGKELFFMNGNKLCVVDGRAAGSNFEAGIPQELFEVSVVVGETRRNRYVVTADGQRFLFVITPQGVDPTPFSVVLNWQIALSRQPLDTASRGQLPPDEGPIAQRSIQPAARSRSAIRARSPRPRRDAAWRTT